MITVPTNGSPTALGRMLDRLARNRAGEASGIYSVCASHPLVLKAAMQQSLLDESVLLIESTANQVNQFGGYTGMTPDQYPPFVYGIADEVGLSRDDIVLGGDHLGPLCWTGEPVSEAMSKACGLVAAYVSAGFQKIHLDASMACAGEGDPLGDEVVAKRTVQMCLAAEKVADDADLAIRPVYIIGTEVPVPGGETEGLDELEVTPVERARRTVETHLKAFKDAGLQSAWERVIGLVVQLGVEFNHTDVRDYVAARASELSQLAISFPRLVYEAHSTDYQPAAAYRELVRDHFAILKVGPQLTFAMREALFALAAIESELVAAPDRSNLLDVCESVMLAEPAYWEKHYPAQEPQARFYHRYSYSDRIRYYWPHPTVQNAVATMLENLSGVTIPRPLLSQYLPSALDVGSGESVSPEDLTTHHVMNVCRTYAEACRGNG